MIKEYKFTNFSVDFFPGFYESCLFNCDMEYYAIEERENEEGGKWELDFKQFQKDVGLELEEVYKNYFIKDDKIISNIVFSGYSSPEYYNFETDKIVLLVDFDREKLENYCFNEKKVDFLKFLSDNFTDRDGFISFIEKDFENFILQYQNENKTGRCLDVLLEFYFLQNLDDDFMEFEIVQIGCDKIVENMIQVEK